MPNRPTSERPEGSWVQGWFCGLTGKKKGKLATFNTRHKLSFQFVCIFEIKRKFFFPDLIIFDVNIISHMIFL